MGCDEIISRSGYTTIMETRTRLIVWMNPIDTPPQGQTEQEYLPVICKSKVIIKIRKAAIRIPEPPLNLCVWN